MYVGPGESEQSVYVNTEAITTMPLICRNNIFNVCTAKTAKATKTLESVRTASYIHTCCFVFVKTRGKKQNQKYS